MCILTAYFSELPYGLRDLVIQGPAALRILYQNKTPKKEKPI